LFQYDPTVSFWNFLAAGNYAGRFYKHAMVDVSSLQRELQAKANLALHLVEAAVLGPASPYAYPRPDADSSSDSEEKALSLELNLDLGLGIVAGLILEAGSGVELSLSKAQNEAISDLATALTVAQGEFTTRAWANLLPRLITKFHDGYRAEALTSPSVSMVKLFYSKSWLDATGYWNNRPNSGPDTIMFAPSSRPGESQGFSLGLVLCLVLIASMLSAWMGMAAAAKRSASAPLLVYKAYPVAYPSTKTIGRMSIRQSGLNPSCADGNGEGSGEEMRSGQEEEASGGLPKIPFGIRSSMFNVFGGKPRPSRREYIQLDL
jgi:hypothetical protein